MVEQWNRDGGTVEQLWWNSGKDMVEQCNSGTVMVNSGTEMVEQWNSYGGTLEKRRWNSGTMMVEQWNRYSRTVEEWNR